MEQSESVASYLSGKQKYPFIFLFYLVYILNFLINKRIGREKRKLAIFVDLKMVFKIAIFVDLKVVFALVDKEVLI